MIALIAALTVAPLVLYGSYRFQRRRGIRHRQHGHSTGGDPKSKRRRGSSRQADLRRLGYRYADDKIFVHGSGVFTGIVLGTSTDEFATATEVGDTAMRPVGVYRELLGLFDGQEVICHERVCYRPITTDGWLAQLLANAWNPTKMYRILSAKVAAHITHSTPQRMWTLIVRLGDCPPPTGSDPFAEISSVVLGAAQERLTATDLAPWWALADVLHDVTGRYGAEPLTRRDLLWLIRKPGHGHLPVPDAPVTSRRPWLGGFFELAASIRGGNLGGGYIQLHHRDPRTGADETSYTATLVVADQPPRQVFNARAAWSRRLGRLACPAEISWRYTLIPPAQWKRMADKAVSNLDDERRDREKAGADEDLSFEARRDQAEQIKADNADDDAQPGMVGRLRLTVSAASTQLLARAIQDVKSAMGDVDVQVPAHAALPLLLEQLPGETVTSNLGSLSAGAAGGLALWRRYSDTYLPALGLLGSHNQVGDRLQTERGRVLGWIGMAIAYVKSNGTVAFFDPHAQIGRGHGAGVAVIGQSGGGKTGFAMLMFFWLSESGVKCSVLDPKIDFAGFVYYLSFGPQVLDPQFMVDADAGILGTPGSRFQPVNREFWDDTTIIDLARGARGSQDPWRITGTFTDGYNLALDLTDVLFTEQSHRSIVRKGLRMMFAAYKEAAAAGESFRCGYGDVLAQIRGERDELEIDYQNARRTGADTSTLRHSRDEFDEVITRLENGEEIPFLRLLMGKGSDPQAQASNHPYRRLIYTMAGFKTPDHPENPDLWTDADRNASAAMLAVLCRMRQDNLSGRLVVNPVTGDPGIPPTAAFVDEGNMVTANPAGRGYLTVNLRQGRSLNSVLFFMDQQPRGIDAIEKEARKDGTEVNQFGTVALFKQRSKDEARAGLTLLRSSDDNVSTAEIDALARKLQSEEVGGLLRIGDCAMRDPDSRVAAVSVDQMFHVIQRAAQTNPKLKPVDWAIEVPTDPGDWEINPDALLRVRTNIAASAVTESVNAADLIDEDDVDDVARGDGDRPWIDDNDDLAADDPPAATQAVVPAGAP